MVKSTKTAKASKNVLVIQDIEKNVVIDAGITNVWDALTDPAAIGGWTDDDSVKVDLKKGGAYKIFGGDTTGYFINIEKPNVLEYSWRMGEWDDKWADSLVRWELHPYGKKTKVKLTHVNLPTKDERDSHDEGWDVYFLEPMKSWLETKKN